MCSCSFMKRKILPAVQVCTGLFSTIGMYVFAVALKHAHAVYDKKRLQQSQVSTNPQMMSIGREGMAKASVLDTVEPIH
eukprot:71097-Amorphochlora_amoeboformis.AAC.1